MPADDADGIVQPPSQRTTAVAAPTDVPTEQRTASRRKSFTGRDLTKGSIPRNLWWLAWPSMVEGVLNVADQIADIIWAGIIGASTIAGVGVAQIYRQLTQTGRMGFDTAMRAQVSRAVGAGDMRLANHLALQGFTVSAVLSLFLVTIGVLFTVPLMRVLGVGEEVIDAGADYLRIQFLSVGALAFRQMSGAALQAAGDAMTPMRTTTLTRTVHIGLTPFLVFGWMMFPEIGIAGAALADVLSQVLGAAWNFSVLFRGTSRLHLTLRGYRPDFPVLRRVVTIGMPAAITGMERSFANLVVLGLVAQFGTLSVAAFSVTRRAESFSNLGSGGLGRASGVLVGQNIGAGQPQRARQTVLWALGIVTSLSVVIAGLLFTFPSSFVTIFTRDPELISQAVVWLRILALSYLFLGMGQVFNQSFNTAGDTLAPMLVTLFSIWGIQQPLAMMLTGVSHTISFPGFSFTLPTIAHLGEFGIAWAIAAAMFLRSAIYVPYFYWGKWLTKKVM